MVVHGVVVKIQVVVVVVVVDDGVCSDGRVVAVVGDNGGAWGSGEDTGGGCGCCGR